MEADLLDEETEMLQEAANTPYAGRFTKSLLTLLSIDTVIINVLILITNAIL